MNGGRLETVGMTVRFAGLVANDALDLLVEPGAFVGLIGPNGAGKTTAFNCITGFVGADAGRILLDGEDITRTSPAARAQRGLVRTFQQARLFGHLTVLENLLLGRHLHYGARPWQSALGLPSGRRAERRALAAVTELAVEVGIADVLDRAVGTLPYGTRRTVELARALAAEPRVLLLDEPGAGLDADESAELAVLLRRLHTERGLSVLLIEHDVPLVLSLCSWIYVLDFGRLLAAGPPAAIRRDERVHAAYMGRAAGIDELEEATL